jgi:hypothetical protein
MEKILVEVFVPSIEKTFDVYIPQNLKMFEIEILLSTSIAELSSGYFAKSNDTVLCDRKNGIILDINKSALELGLQNGSTLMLI